LAAYPPPRLGQCARDATAVVLAAEIRGDGWKPGGFSLENLDPPLLLLLFENGIVAGCNEKEGERGKKPQSVSIKKPKKRDNTKKNWLGAE